MQVLLEVIRDARSAIVGDGQQIIHGVRANEAPHGAASQAEFVRDGGDGEIPRPQCLRRLAALPSTFQQAAPEMITAFKRRMPKTR
jgi:hypothetical protein